MSKKQPGLGTFSAPVKFQVTVSGTTYEWSGACAFTPVGTETTRSLSGTGSFLPVGTPTPTPPQLTGLTVTPDHVAPGGTVQVKATVGPVHPGGMDSRVNLAFDGTRLTGSTEILVPAGMGEAAVTLTAQPGGLAQVPITASLQGISKTVSVTITDFGPPPPTPTPAPGPLKNVRDYGAKGDGTTDDVTALNALIRSSPPGSVLYFPAGTYRLADALKVLRPDLGFLGDGDQSVLKITGASYHVQLGSGQPFTGFSFKKLHFYGTPGKYMADGTAHGGVLNFGSKGTVFEDCLWTGCSEPVMNAGAAGSTYGTVAKNCRILGWGRVAIFCNGGERISGCQLIQDDPNFMGGRSSHGFYIHSGCTDVEIADTLIQNARKYAAQVYGEQLGTKTTGVRLLRLTVKNCANGLITAHSQMGAGDIHDLLIEGCQISGVYGGAALSIKNGADVIIRNNVLDGNAGSGLQLGVWAPYEPGFSLGPVLVEGNTIHGCRQGLWALQSNGGTFNGVTVRNNDFSGNQAFDIHLEEWNGVKPHLTLANNQGRVAGSAG